MRRKGFAYTETVVNWTGAGPETGPVRWARQPIQSCNDHTMPPPFFFVALSLIFFSSRLFVFNLLIPPSIPPNAVMSAALCTVRGEPRAEHDGRMERVLPQPLAHLGQSASVIYGIVCMASSRAAWSLEGRA